MTSTNEAEALQRARRMIEHHNATVSEVRILGGDR
jgi:hypothetical protein